MKPAPPGRIHLNVWLPDHPGPEITLAVARAEAVWVNLDYQARVAGALSSAAVSAKAEARLFKVAAVDVMLVCPGADLRPLRIRLALPPSAKHIARFILTPRRAGRLNLAVLLLIDGECIHEVRSTLLVAEPAASSRQVVR